MWCKLPHYPLLTHLWGRWCTLCPPALEQCTQEAPLLWLRGGGRCAHVMFILGENLIWMHKTRVGALGSVTKASGTTLSSERYATTMFTGNML